MPGKDGVHQITAAPTDDDDDPDEEELSRDAFSQANDYCVELFQKKPQILSAKKSPIPNTERSIYQIIVVLNVARKLPAPRFKEDSYSALSP